MNKTKIEWCDSTWNPVTGCLHECKYCYARRIAERFKTKSVTTSELVVGIELSEPFMQDGKKQPYPFGFVPTLHRYKLNEPQKMSGHRNIFVCSMADLFGDWVPDQWIKEVFLACADAQQHDYFFLTKNPQRYVDLRKNGIQPSNAWIGTSITCEDDAITRLDHLSNTWNMLVRWFVSIEPILGRFSKTTIESISAMEWVIIGAETGNRKEKVVPSAQWVLEIAEECKKVGTPVFMKDSLIPIVGEKYMVREFPKERNENP